MVASTVRLPEFGFGTNLKEVRPLFTATVLDDEPRFGSPYRSGYAFRRGFDHALTCLHKFVPWEPVSEAVSLRVTEHFTFRFPWGELRNMFLRKLFALWILASKC